MRVLVTGGGGFVGSHAVRKLTEQGHEVTYLARRPLVRRGNEAARMIVGDLAGASSAGDAFRGQDVVVHCAGPTSALHGGHVPMSAAHATSNALAWAARAGVARFVHLSSLAVCSPPPVAQRLDDRSPVATHPSWNRYARVKAAEELLVHRAHASGLVPAVVLRPGVVFGPGDPHATPLFRRALSLRFPFLVGSGRNRVAALTVEDLADAVSRAVDAPGIDGRCYPLAGEAPTTQGDLFRMHAQAAGVPEPEGHLPMRAALLLAALVELGYRRGSEPPFTRTGVWIIGSRSEADSSRAFADLGWRGRSSIEDAIVQSTALATTGSLPRASLPIFMTRTTADGGAR